MTNLSKYQTKVLVILNRGGRIISYQENEKTINQLCDKDGNSEGINFRTIFKLEYFGYIRCANDTPAIGIDTLLITKTGTQHLYLKNKAMRPEFINRISYEYRKAQAIFDYIFTKLDEKCNLSNKYQTSLATTITHSIACEIIDELEEMERANLKGTDFRTRKDKWLKVIKHINEGLFGTEGSLDWLNQKLSLCENDNSILRDKLRKAEERILEPEKLTR
jgi:bacterioferritin (cytochrome b1)